MCKYNVSICKRYLEHSVRQSFSYDAFDLDRAIFLSQAVPTYLSRVTYRIAAHFWAEEKIIEDPPLGEIRPLYSTSASNVRIGQKLRIFLDGALIYSPGLPARTGALIEGSKIVAIGPKCAEIFDSSRDSRLDLSGKFVAPSFGDGHAHPLFAGREAAGPAITGLTSIAEIQSEVARYAADHSEGWIVGGAYEASLVEGGDFDAAWLDEVVADRPVLLHAADHHTIWVNSRALELAGISKGMKDPQGGTIARRLDGSPKGTLREPQAMDLILSKIPARTIDDDVAALSYATKRYLQHGVTYATDSWVEAGMAQIYKSADESGKIAIDLNLSFLVSPDNWRSDSDRIEAERELFAESKSIKAGSVKFLADGALSSGTAALLEPYEDQPGFAGIRIWSDDELFAAVQHFDRLGFQIHIHAIGDAAVRQALDALEEMITKNREWDRRPVIVHAQLISDEDIPRFADLGVIANMQPLWMYLDPMNKELIAPRIGARNELQYRLRDMAHAGVTIAYGSDWPVTSEIPMLALGVPIHRTKPGSSDLAWNPDQSIDLELSWSFYTSSVAYQNFREDELGSLEVGKRADFIVLSENPFDIDPRKIHQVKIDAVYKAGVRVI